MGRAEGKMYRCLEVTTFLEEESSAPVGGGGNFHSTMGRQEKAKTDRRERENAAKAPTLCASRTR